MKTNELYARLELLNAQFESTSPCPTGEATRSKAKSGNSLAQFVQSVLNFLCGTKEPKIQERCDRSGHTYFTAYDPVDQTQHTFSTEKELRVWLDQRYYQ